MRDPLQAILGDLGLGLGTRPALDVISIPLERVEQVLRIMDETEAVDEFRGPMRQRWDRWARLHDMFPCLRGKAARLNTDNITRPVFEIVGDEKRPEPGRRYRRVEFFGPNLVDNMIDRIDEAARRSTLLAQWQLWSFICAVFHEELDPESRHALNIAPGEWVAVVEYHGDEDC